MAFVTLGLVTKERHLAPDHLVSRYLNHGGVGSQMPAITSRAICGARMTPWFWAKRVTCLLEVFILDANQREPLLKSAFPEFWSLAPCTLTNIDQDFDTNRRQ